MVSRHYRSLKKLSLNSGCIGWQSGNPDKLGELILKYLSNTSAWTSVSKYEPPTGTPHCLKQGGFEYRAKYPHWDKQQMYSILRYKALPAERVQVRVLLFLLREEPIVVVPPKLFHQH